MLEMERDKDQHPNDQHPNDQHPNDQHPNDQYPNDQHPNDQHPNDQYPTDQHPNDQHPNDQQCSSEGFDIEPLLQALGCSGIYQISQMTLQLMYLFQYAFAIMAIVFIGYKPPHQCAMVNDSSLEALTGWPDNSSANMAVHYEQCRIQVTRNDSGDTQVFELPCVEGFQYEGPKDASVFTEWDLTCEKSALTELSQTLMTVGQGLGAFGFTSLADRFGRKPMYIISSLSMLAVSVAIAFSPNFHFFIVCRVLIGVVQEGSGLVGYTMFIELLPKKWRTLAGLTAGAAWSVGVMLLPGLAYSMRDYSWRHLQLLISAASLYSLILPWCLDESMRWLVANHRKTTVERVLKKASRMNGVPYHKVHQALDAILTRQPTKEAAALTSTNENAEKRLGHEIQTNENGEKHLGHEIPTNARPVQLSPDGSPRHQDDPANENARLKEAVVFDGAKVWTVEGSEGVKKYTALDVLRSKLMAKITLCITYVWIANALTYYGLMLTSARVSGDRFLNFFLQALMEFPAFLTVYLCLRKFGRKNVTCGFLCLAAVSLLLSSLLLATVSSPVVGPVTNVLSLMGKYGVSGSFCALFIFCPEMYPTNMRTAGLGIASALARLGGMVAPYSNNLAALALWAPGILFGVMCLLGVVAMLQLPETRGRPMPTTIEEIQHWHHTPATAQGPPHAHHH